MSDSAVGELGVWRLPLPGNDGAAILIDQLTGLPLAIEPPPSSMLALIRCASSLLLRVGGREVPALGGGLDYPDAEELHLVPNYRRLGNPRYGTWEPVMPAPMAGDVFRVTADVGHWSVALEYQLLEEFPRVRLELEISSSKQERRAIRNVELEVSLSLDPEDWLLHAPGNAVRPGARLADLDGELAVSPAAGSLGSPGLVALDHRDARGSIVLWPFSRSEIGWISVAPVAQGLRLRVITDLSGAPLPGCSLRYSGFNLDILRSPWAEVRKLVRPALRALGVESPGAKPRWAQSAAIYEVQVGRSVFSGGWYYEPYPDLEDVTADLGRILALGFDTIQLMPRQPFPSYNVVSYDDLDVTYGGASQLHELVERAHELNMRVVLDIVLHGVLDRRSIHRALARVEASGALDEPNNYGGDVFADSAEARRALKRAWCQHIVDFGPYWLEAAPEIHPLTIEEPEWFCRDSAGELVGIYTEAFDLAEECWQTWFCERVLSLIEDYRIDGFRFDAPTYNNFANWSPTRRARASASSTGAVGLFERLRRELKQRFPEVLMFTEPSGVVLRESMDLNYNYDELWLVPALMGELRSATAVRNGAELARWLDERDATLPSDALTCHHLDSHDTFWWPAPGMKWRREQIGLEAARALSWCLTLIGGAFLLFTGGELGIEDDLSSMLAVRRERREFREGAVDFCAAAINDESIFSILRHRDNAGVLGLVNLSSSSVTADAKLLGGWRMKDGDAVSVPIKIGPYEARLVDVVR